MKLTKNTLSNGFALATAILWVVCSVFVATFPGFSNTITQWWMHGMEVAPYEITLSSVIWGGLTLMASAWLSGYILGWSLEVVSKNGKN